MDKLVDWLEWPDDAVLWNLPALMKALAVIGKRPADARPKAIIVFMMPYSSGIAGILLKWMTNLPLILNLNDSPTCTDMHPFFASRLHYWLAIGLENFYIRQSDAIIYVSQKNLDMVRARQPKSQHGKFHLIRCGVDPTDYQAPLPPRDPDKFQIAYTGGMSGWNQFIDAGPKPSLAKRLYRAWMGLGRFELVQLDQRGSTPVFMGRAIHQIIERNPDWKDKIRLDVYGNRYPQETVDRVLANTEIGDVVSVYGSRSHTQAIQIARGADLLFMAIPDRADGSPGGRISLKTYEYLMTDRPILAAIPKGENWDYLSDKPGVWLIEPNDVDGMIRIVSKLAAEKFAGKSCSVDRSKIVDHLSYASRAREYEEVLNQVVHREKEPQGHSIGAVS